MTDGYGPAPTRRQLVAGATAMGALALMPQAAAASHRSDPQEILDVSATLEGLATVLHTVGHERGLGGDATTQANLAAAAREELIHLQTLTASTVGAAPVSGSIWIPDSVFATRERFLGAVEAVETVLVNAYLVAVTAFGNAGNGRLARIAAELMGVELVHRALARQALGKLGNDRAFAKYSNPEEARDAPNPGVPGFRRISSALTALESGGFGFGSQGAEPGAFHEVDEVSRRTPDPAGVNTRVPR